MKVKDLINKLVCTNYEADVIIADSPFCDGTAGPLELVTEDEQGRIVLSPDVLLVYNGDTQTERVQ